MTALISAILKKITGIASARIKRESQVRRRLGRKAGANQGIGICARPIGGSFVPCETETPLPSSERVDSQLGLRATKPRIRENTDYSPGSFADKISSRSIGTAGELIWEQFGITL